MTSIIQSTSQKKYVYSRNIDVSTGEILARQPASEEAPDERFLSEEEAPDGGLAPAAHPYSKTGVEGSHIQEQVLSVDWSTITVHAGFDVALQALREVGMDVALAQETHGTRFYRELYKSPFGVNVQAVPVNENQEHCCIALSGTAMQHFGLQAFYELGGVLARLGQSGVYIKCTRLDLAHDTQTFTVQDVIDADEAGLLQTGSRAREVKQKTGSKKDGHTYYIGSRESEAFVRVYDKRDGASFGTEAFTRVELELHADRANQAFWRIVAFGMQDVPQVAAELLNGFMDIQTSWWQDFKLATERAWLKLRHKVPTIASKKVYLRSQVKRTLATVLDALDHAEKGSGWAFLHELLEDGRKSFTKREDDLIRYNDPPALPTFAAYLGGV